MSRSTRGNLVIKWADHKIDYHSTYSNVKPNWPGYSRKSFVLFIFAGERTVRGKQNKGQYDRCERNMGQQQ
jgi:hypothetical protein